MIQEKRQKEVKIVEEKQKKGQKKPQTAKPPQQQGQQGSQTALQVNEEVPAFFCRQEKIKLKRGTSQYVNMVFLPLVLEQHRCTIIFADN